MRVLIVGLGSIAKKHIDALGLIDSSFDLFALRSSSPADELAGITNIYDLNEIPSDISFAIISNPTHLHYKFIVELTERDIPLFIEKPVVHELAGLDELVSKVNNKGVFTYVACNLRFHPCLQFLHNYIESNQDIRVNEVNTYCGSYLPDWRPGKNFREIYSANTAMGGGVHLDLFHELDYVTWIFGLPNLSKVTKTSNSSLHIDAIDYANYILCYDTFTASIVINYYRRTAKRTLEVVFENDTWLVDLINNQITNAKNEIVFEDKNFKVLDTYKMQLSYFIDKLKTHQNIMNSLGDSAAVLKICLTDEG